MRTNEIYGSKKYLKAEDLNNRSVRVTIERITMREFEEGKKLILHFANKDKALILNRTNANTIEDLTKTDLVEDWIGWTIVLISQNVDYQGKRGPAIRIDQRPQSAIAPKHEPRRQAPPPVIEEVETEYDEDGNPISGGTVGDDIPFDRMPSY